MNKRLRRSIFLSSVLLGLGVNVIVTTNVKADTVGNSNETQVVAKEKQNGSDISVSTNKDLKQTQGVTQINSDKNHVNSTSLNTESLKSSDDQVNLKQTQNKKAQTNTVTFNVKQAQDPVVASVNTKSLRASAYSVQEGWRRNSDGDWVYTLSNGQVARKEYSNSWQHLSDSTGNHWFYVNEYGVPYMNTWITDSNNDTYYMNNIGHIDYNKGWRRNSDGDWVFVHSNGKVAKKHYQDSWDRLPDSTGWHWFYLNEYGVPYMNTWITDSNNDTYYMNNMGHIDYNKGWRRNSDGDWVFVHSNGKVAKKHYQDSWDRLPDSTGWHWFYLNEYGVPYMNTWITDSNNDTYYMNNMGHIDYNKGWRRNSDGDWVFVHSNGKVAKKHYQDSWDRLPDSTGWHWFYLNEYGVPYMNTWITDSNNDTYYMNNMGHIDYNKGWRRNSDGDWVFVHSDGKVAKKHYQDSWQLLPDSTGWHWFYLNEYGVPYMNTWITDSNNDTYYMNNMGHIDYNKGWRRNSDGDWVFVHSDGKVAKKHYQDSWQLLPDSTGWHWFYLNEYGVPYMNTWITDSNNDTYYMNNMGHIDYNKGWRRNSDGDWVFVHSDGKVAKKHYQDSWQLLPDSTGWHWFYLNEYGVPYMNTWITDSNNDTYYMNNMGHIDYNKGWRRNSDGDWVFVHSDGKVAKKHYQDSWQLLPDSTGWHWFYLNEYGVPYTNTWITDEKGRSYYMNSMGYIA